MKELIEQIAKALVDNPEQVSVRPIEGGDRPVKANRGGRGTSATSTTDIRRLLDRVTRQIRREARNTSST